MTRRRAVGWTTLADVRTHLRRRWDDGQLLAAWAAGQPFHPVDVTLRGPVGRDLTDRFDEVRAWRQEWLAVVDRSADLQLVMKSVGRRSIGANELPARLVVDGGWEALWRLLQVTAEVRRFTQLRDSVPTGAHAAMLVNWMNAHPLRVLAHQPDAEWTRVLATVRWLVSERGHSRYLRQVPVPGVDTKFIETHRAVLADLLDVVLPADTIDQTVPKAQFARRYGFRIPPLYVRFRTLGATPPRLPGVPEMTVRLDSLEAAAADVGTVFVLENEITYLAFPAVPDAIAVFGGGYGFTAFAALPWLSARRVYYWGDLDTHGFAILDRLRATAPTVESFLMDRATLLAHPEQWVREPTQARGPLSHLTPAEAALHDDLVAGTYGAAIRLEQERVGFPHLEASLTRLLS
ncbi:hypothetical protein Ga0074812_12516 [Parafrankia irregularis]|uniref:Wadjet protein JetD C-terminal domain-containing protein n=1 Tax=Parafrankia irregularis TaxID=795642 RepID=A0A0S4QU15_9ACTN|nr:MULTISPECIES: Wadjet anti-phage system protein JetD domain-containing protein [Frankiaceae]KPM50859.1 hypothetical protein ACG83_38285 [Frankia sp. R43]MBE3204796.1 hypothetical protein [Parafrankia sp. CH37]CUU59127.1 hypothetical protein Ga0074812_12516 [Parafrankia irregularis]